MGKHDRNPVGRRCDTTIRGYTDGQVRFSRDDPKHDTSWMDEGPEEATLGWNEDSDTYVLEGSRYVTLSKGACTDCGEELRTDEYKESVCTGCGMVAGAERPPLSYTKKSAGRHDEDNENE